MNAKVKFALAVIMVHLFIAMLHGGAHQHLLIDLSSSQQLFVWTLIVAAPLLAALLLLGRFRRAGGALLLLSMAGSLGFGLWNHFLVRAADNVASAPPGAWGLTFRVTAGLLVLTESLGCGLGISLLV